MALKQFSIQNGFEFGYEKNDKLRVTAKCKQAPRCKWRIHVFRTNDKNIFQIKTIHPEHQCGTHYKNKFVNLKWIARQYLEMIQDIPRLSPSALVK